MEILGGFLMALADSVPGVSGGTVAFIVGIYDQLVGSIAALGGGTPGERRRAVRFLVKLAAAWAVGFGLAAVALTHLFEEHIYTVSSTFIGLILFAVPLIAHEERATLKGNARWAFWAPLGALAVAVLVVWNATVGSVGEPMDMAALGFWDGVGLVFAGLVAASVMLLPGMSGSTVLLVLGLYLPLMGAVKGLIGGNVALLWPCVLFAVGALLGLAFMAKVVDAALERFRPQTVFLLIGLMLGSLLAVAAGPLSLDVPLPPLSAATFSWPGFLLGGALIGGLELLRRVTARRSHPSPRPL